MLGSLQLEVRRVSGHIRNNQVYWGKRSDGKGVCVFDPEGIEIIDNAELDEPPWIVFEFKFRDVSQKTRRVTENSDSDSDTDAIYETDSDSEGTFIFN